MVVSALCLLGAAPGSAHVPGAAHVPPAAAPDHEPAPVHVPAGGGSSAAGLLL